MKKRVLCLEMMEFCLDTLDKDVVHPWFLMIAVKFCICCMITLTFCLISKEADMILSWSIYDTVITARPFIFTKLLYIHLVGKP